MTGERWRQIEEIFGCAVELPATEREVFVAERCSNDSTLREEILSMLAIDGDAQLRGVVGAAASDLVRDGAATRIGQRIGPYRVVELVGHGGMGSVYRAERADGEFQQAVAIKLLDHGTGARATARFRDERQILAKLAHPNIVRLVDGGTTDDGTPYLVMDYVAGVRITELELPVERCVELVATLCEALAYAHGLGVIHRDIKPSNILVGEHGPLLLDFGIAKLVDPISGREAHTRTGAALLTPEYASPEQARGEPVTAATDIYSVGAVLYELVARRRPLALAGNMLEVLRVISEVAPEKPSAVAPAGRAISRDLDRIVLGALHKDAHERYASAAALAADLRAYLAGERVAPPRRRRSPWWLAVPAVAVAATAAITIASRSTPWLAAGEHTLAVHLTGDAALAPAAQRMAVRALRDDRRFVTADHGADVTAELAIRRDGDGVAIGGTLVANGGHPVQEVRAHTVESALASLVPAIGDAVGGDRPPRGPDAGELAAMAKVGATSFDEYRELLRIEEAQFGTIKADTVGVLRDLEALVARDPQWAHPWVLLVVVPGFSTHEQGDSPALARAKSAVGATERDPAGRAVLRSMELMQHDHLPEAATLLEPVAADNPDDMVISRQLHAVYEFGGRANEDIAILRRMHELRPDLQWGADLAGQLRAIGRGADVEPLVRAWIERAPDSEQAQVSSIALDIAAGHAATAVERAKDLLVLHDEAAHRLKMLCDVLIAADRTQEAARIAEKLLHGPVPVRAAGLQRMGTIEILEGRFAAAMQTLLPTGPDAAEIAFNSPILEIGLDVALALRRDDVIAAYDAAIANRHRGWDDVIGAQQHPFERALAHGECPSIEKTLDPITWPAGGIGRDDGRRWLLRAAAERGCASCKDVLRAGRLPMENDDRSAFRFAVCAESEGDLALANDMFAHLREMRLSSLEHVYAADPFVWVMARFHHARVLEKLGKPDEARREYQDFLAHWEHADTPLPELAEARAALERLAK
jgi:hypothetical protein